MQRNGWCDALSITAISRKCVYVCGRAFARVLRKICLASAFCEAKAKIPPSSPTTLSTECWIRRRWRLKVKGVEKARRTLRRGRCTTMQRRPDKWEMLSQEGEPECATLSRTRWEKEREREREGQKRGKRARTALMIVLQDAAYYRARRTMVLCKRHYRVVRAADGFCIATLFSGYQFLENSPTSHAFRLSFS